MKKKTNRFALCMFILTLFCIVGYIGLMFDEITLYRVCFMVLDIFLAWYWGRLYLMSRKDRTNT